MGHRENHQLLCDGNCSLLSWTASLSLAASIRMFACFASCLYSYEPCSWTTCLRSSTSSNEGSITSVWSPRSASALNRFECSWAWSTFSRSQFVAVWFASFCPSRSSWDELRVQFPDVSGEPPSSSWSSPQFLTFSHSSPFPPSD